MAATSSSIQVMTSMKTSTRTSMIANTAGRTGHDHHVRPTGRSCVHDDVEERSYSVTRSGIPDGCGSAPLYGAVYFRADANGPVIRHKTVSLRPVMWAAFPRESDRAGSGMRLACS